MDVIARNVLVASIVASSLGAIVMCLLVFRFSLAPPSDEPPRARHQRIFVTRLGHAFEAIVRGTSAAVTTMLNRIDHLERSRRGAVAASGPRSVTDGSGGSRWSP